MQISKSRLKEIIKEELTRVQDNYEEVEQQQVSDLNTAYEIAVKLEQFVGKNELARKMVGELIAILANVSNSEAQEIEEEY
jgi:stress-induced morphogen